MKILVVGSGGHNKGSLSVIKSTIKMLKEEISGANISLMSRFPDFDSKQCEVTAFKYPTFQHGLFARLKAILSLIQCTVLAILYMFPRVDVNWLVEVDRLKLLQAYVKTDSIVVCGTDDISDTYGFFYPIDLLYKKIFIATLLKKPIVINATQIGPFSKNLSGKILIFLVNLVLNRVSLITVRDQISRRKLLEMGVNSPLIYLTADPAFLLRPASYRRTKQILLREGIDTNAKPLVGVNPSALIYHYTDGSKSEEKLESYVHLMSQVISYVIKKLNATVVLVPHVFARNNDDRIICKKIYRRVKCKSKLCLITNEYTPEELKGIIGQFDLFISSRMHPVIHAISMCTPVIGIDYTFKVEELMRRVSQERGVCHITNLDYKELSSKIDAIYFAREKITETLRLKSKVMQNYAYSNAKLITAYLKKWKAGG